MEKIRVGITGQSGFIGTHLSILLKSRKDRIDQVPFLPEYFNDDEQLRNFVNKCDVIVHLAAKNRGDPEEVYRTNILLVSTLIQALEKTNRKPHVIFSSSIQEIRDNAYGKSKLDGRELFENWSKRNQAKFTGLIIPNVFGPFGKPFYNSVISTFAYQLTHQCPPMIETNADLDLIYVSSLTEKIYQLIIDDEKRSIITIPADRKMKVSQILSKFQEFHDTYLENHIIPRFSDDFDVALFNTFRSFIEPDHFPITPVCNTDNRGFFIELVKEFSGGQTSFSVTLPGITRGNHYHMRKIERFCVLNGEACLRLRRIGTDKIVEYHLSGSKPSFVDIPVFYTHDLSNEGKTELTTIFWTNELFNPQNPDTYYENVVQENS